MEHYQNKCLLPVYIAEERKAKAAEEIVSLGQADQLA